MDGFSVTAAQVLGQVGTEWSLVGLGNVSGDKKAGMVFRRHDGTIAEYQMDGFNVVAAQLLGQIGPDWNSCFAVGLQ
jgi:hypothetical protein